MGRIGFSGRLRSGFESAPCSLCPLNRKNLSWVSNWLSPSC
jgi:hypothetical protein